MAKKKSKCTLNINGNHELIQSIEKLGGNIEESLVRAFQLSGKNATNRYIKFIQEHKFTGITEEAIVMNPEAVIENNKITLQTGFDIDRGGAPAVWLDRGTPQQKPLNWVRKIKQEKPVKNAIGYSLGQDWRKLNQ